MAKHVQGVQTTIANLRKVAALVAPAANEASKRAMEPMLAEAKANAPVRSGRLKRDLVLRRAKDSPKTRPVYLIGVKPDSPARAYAHLIEFGLGPVKNATPFMTMAFETCRESALQIWGRTFGPALEKSAARIAARRARGRP